MKYNIWRGVLKALISMAIFAIPVLIDKFPDIANISLGGAGVLIINFLKVKYVIK